MARSEIEMKMSLDSSGVKAGMAGAKESVQGFADKSLAKLKSVHSFLKTGLFAGLSFVGLKKMLDDMTEIKRAADRLGVSAESFQRLSFAAKQTGVDTDRLADAMKDLDVKLQDGIMRGGSFAELIEELGMDMGELARMKPDERILAFADAIKNASGSLSRFGADEFGDAMFELLPLLEMGSEGILELGSSATIASAEALAAAERMSKKVDAITNQVKGFFMQAIGNGAELFEWLVAGATQAVIEISNIIKPMFAMFQAGLTWDFEGFKDNFNKMVDASHGSAKRIKEAMDGIIDDQLAEKYAQEQAQMTKAELERLKKTKEASRKAAEEKAKHVEKVAKLQEKIDQERQKRLELDMTAEEKLNDIKKRRVELEKELLDIDPFGDEVAHRQKALELQKLMTAEQKAEQEFWDEREAARQAEIESRNKMLDAQVEALEVERELAELAGDHEKVNQLERQIEKQKMINDLIKEGNVSDEQAVEIVEKYIERKEAQKQKELDVLRARADGHDHIADALQNQIDKEQEALDIANEFGISLEEARVIAEKLAAIRFGPDLNQSGFVTRKEQRAWDLDQKAKARDQRAREMRELRDEREEGGALRKKIIPKDLTTRERMARDAERAVRRRENQEIGRRIRRGEDEAAVRAEIEARRQQRAELAQIQDLQKRRAEEAKRAQEQKELEQLKKGGDQKKLEDRQKAIEEDRRKRLQDAGVDVPPPPKEPVKPKNEVVDKLGPKLDDIITQLQGVNTKLDC